MAIQKRSPRPCSISKLFPRPISILVADADGTITPLIERLDRDEMPMAAQRIGDGFGRYRMVK